jgi:hypothetical protein
MAGAYKWIQMKGREYMRRLNLFRAKGRGDMEVVFIRDTKWDQGKKHKGLGEALRRATIEEGQVKRI